MTQNTSWSYSVDFTKSDGGFTIWTGFGSNNGQYSPNMGWEESTAPNTINGLWGRFVAIQKLFPATTLTSVTMTYDLTKGFSNCPTCVAVQMYDGVSEPIITMQASITGNGQIFSWIGNDTGITFFMIEVLSDGFSSDPSGFSGSGRIKHVVVTGIGSNPFLLDDSAECPCNYLGVGLEEMAEHV